MNYFRLAVCAILITTTISFEINGVNVVSVPFTRVRYTDDTVASSLEHVRSTGANFISIPVTIFQDSLDSSEMAPIYKEVTTEDKTNDTPTDEELARAIQAAKTAGLQSMLSLQVEVNQAGYIGSSQIGNIMAPYQYRRWFEKYKKFALHYATIAQAGSAEMFSIGQDLFHLAQFENHWIELIDEVRKVFKGELVYAASSNKEFREAGFFWKLDYIGIFTHLLDHEITKNYKTGDLADKIDDLKIKIDYLYKFWKKPILMMNIVAEPVPEFDKNNKLVKVHHSAQALFMKELIAGLSSIKEIKGIFVGNWVPHPQFGGNNNVSNSPQLKEAEIVIREAFKGSQELPKITSTTSHGQQLFCKKCINIDL